MQSVIKRGIDFCFQDDETLKIIAENVFSQKNQKVKSLQFQSIKSIMKSEMITDYYGFIIFSLIFGERLNLWDFVDPKFKIPRTEFPFTISFFYCRVLYARAKYQIRKTKRRLFAKLRPKKVEENGIVNLRKMKGLTGDLEKTFLELRRDANAMLVAVDQYLSHKPICYFKIICEKDQLRIGIQFCQGGIIAEIANRKNEEFDLFWAEQFARVAFSRRASAVSLQMLGEKRLGPDHWDQMKAHLNKITANFPVKMPTKNWEEVMKDTNEAVYARSDSMRDFELADVEYRLETEYNSWRTHSYVIWGRLL